MTIRKYSQFLAESKNASLNVSYSNEMSILENEYLKLKSEGLNEEQINENIFSSLLGSLGGGFTDTFKDYVIDWATEKLGIEAFDEMGQPTFFYQVHQVIWSPALESVDPLSVLIWSCIQYLWRNLLPSTASRIHFLWKLG